MTGSFRFVLIALMAVALAACGTGRSVEREAERPVEDLYNSAASAMDAGRYDEARRLFEEVERQHPYSEWSTRAQLMAAFAAYRNGRYDEAILALDRFMQLHPGHRDVDYAQYLKGLSYYEQISDVARDQAMTELAMEAFETLILRFPDSRYARDARYKIDLTRDHLAGKEMEVGRYYLRRNHVNAALNRFQTVVRDYQTTTHVPEALHRLVESYMTLGLTGEATRVAAVLGHNYPGSRWYQDTYRLMDDRQRARILDERSWVDRTVESLFRDE